MKQKVSLVEVESLPDIMEMEDILFYFEKVFKDFPNPKESQYLNLLEILLELAIRQGDTYKPLKEEIKQTISDYIKPFFNFKNYEITDFILSIVGILKLYEFYPLIITNIGNGSLPSSISTELEGFKKEFVDEDDLVDENGFLIKK